MDILHDLPIRASAAKVFAALTTPAGIDQWWTARSAGNAQEGAEYELWFGPDYDWRARVTRCEPDAAFELQLTEAAADWLGTRVGFTLDRSGENTWVRFYHAGWPAANEHYRISNCCWAAYLRILRRYVEYGEVVAYENRLDA